MTSRITYAFCDKPDKAIFMKYIISSKEQLSINKDIGDAGVLLYIHYLRLATTDRPVITDEGVARSLGWTSRKVLRYRLLLTKFGWYKQVKFTRPDGVKMINYHIGKDSVEAITRDKNKAA